MNWPAALTVGAGARFSEVLQVGAGIAPIEWIVGRVAKKTDFIFGLHALVVVPVGLVSPVAGLAYSQRQLRASNSRFYGYRNGTFHYLNPFGGVEIRIAKIAALQVGILYQMEKVNGAWKKSEYINSGFLGSAGLLPYVAGEIFF